MFSGNKRRKPFSGTSWKSSRSIHTSRVRLKRFAHFRVMRMHRGGTRLGVAGAKQRIPVGELEFERVEHGHGARGFFVQIVAQRAFEHASSRSRYRPWIRRCARRTAGSRFGRVAPAAQADDGGHARVVPAVDMAFGHQLHQLALAGDHIGQIEPREFVLVRQRVGKQAGVAQVRQAASRRTGADLRIRACRSSG
jgi:hypothetical protein